MSETHPVALVTGAARRLGATIARTLHGAGYDLALHCRHSRDELGTLVAELELARADSIAIVQGDLADATGLPGLVEAAVARFRRLDALINNASIFRATPVGAITAAQCDEFFAVNARAPLLLAQAAAPHLRLAHGAIVNITDIYAESPLPQHAAYGMSKAALRMATSVLAVDLAPDVRVNAVAPGAILWPENKSDADRDAVLARVPLRRTGTPEEIANTVLWLLRDAGYVTGQTIRVDGGRTLAG